MTAAPIPGEASGSAPWAARPSPGPAQSTATTAARSGACTRPVTIPNAIAFTPDGGAASFADTARGLVWRQRLAPADGWPVAEPEPFIDAAADGLAPDGAVFDRAGRFWNAQWGAGRLACYAPDGRLLGAVRLPASQTTCPAFGGPTLSRLFVTSAHEGLDRAAEPAAGALFALETEAIGQPEHRIGL